MPHKITWDKFNMKHITRPAHRQVWRIVDCVRHSPLMSSAAQEERLTQGRRCATLCPGQSGGRVLQRQPSQWLSTRLLLHHLRRYYTKWHGPKADLSSGQVYHHTPHRELWHSWLRIFQPMHLERWVYRGLEEDPEWTHGRKCLYLHKYDQYILRYFFMSLCNISGLGWHWL